MAFIVDERCSTAMGESSEEVLECRSNDVRVARKELKHVRFLVDQLSARFSIIQMILTSEFDEIQTLLVSVVKNIIWNITQGSTVVCLERSE